MIPQPFADTLIYYLPNYKSNLWMCHLPFAWFLLTSDKSIKHILRYPFSGVFLLLFSHSLLLSQFLSCFLAGPTTTPKNSTNKNQPHIQILKSIWIVLFMLLLKSFIPISIWILREHARTHIRINTIPAIIKWNIRFQYLFVKFINSSILRYLMVACDMHPPLYICMYRIVYPIYTQIAGSYIMWR